MTDLPLRAGAYGPVRNVGLPDGSLQLVAESSVMTRAEVVDASHHYHTYLAPALGPCTLTVPEDGLFIVESFARVQVINTSATKQFWVATFADAIVLDWMSGNDGAFQSSLVERFPAYNSWSPSQQNQYCSSVTTPLDAGTILSLKYATNFNVPTFGLAMLPQIIRLIKVL